MIINSLRKSLFLKQIRRLLYLQTSLNKTYGSINKPVNHFGQNTKFNDTNANLIHTHQKQLDKDHKAAQSQNDHYADDDMGMKENRFDQKKNKEFAFFFRLNQQQKLNLIEEYRQKEMARELSIICREMYYYRENSEAVWLAIQDAFIHFLTPPFDQEKIRSLSKFLSGLGKTKRITKNYEKPIIELLPHSSVQSFVQIVVLMSRIGALGDEFMHTVQKLYWKRKQEFGPLQLNLINYVFAKNARKIDTSLVEKIDSFPLRCIALMLKTFDRSCLVTPIFLKNCVPHILSRRSETTFFDFKHLVNVYLKYQYFDNYHLLLYFDEQYRMLARNVNEETLEQIWQYFPDAVNKNKLPPTFVEGVIQSLKNLRKNKKLSERAWKKISYTFQKFTDSSIRQDLQKLMSQ